MSELRLCTQSFLLLELAERPKEKPLDMLIDKRKATPELTKTDSNDSVP